MNKKTSNLKRPIYPMPGFVKEALQKNQLTDAYFNRPAYQQNDYVGWITRSKREATKQKRLNQMLDELKSADRYMKMKWKAKL